MLWRWVAGTSGAISALSRSARHSVMGRNWPALHTQYAVGSHSKSAASIQAAYYSGPIVRSPYKPVTMPPANLSIPDLIFKTGTSPQDASKEVLVDGVTGKSMTFAEVQEAVGRFASGMARRGLKRGDVVSLFMPNCPDFGVAFLGVQMAGGVVSTVNSLYTVNELEYQMKDSNSSMLITALPMVESASQAAQRCGLKETIVLGLDSPSEANGVTLIPFSAVASDSGSALPQVTVDDNTKEIAILPYSSGTTGTPKGVMLSHYNVIANILQIASDPEICSFNRRANESILAILPFFHIYAMTVLLLNGLYQRARLVTLPKFEPELFLSTCEKHKISQLFLVPPIAIFLCKHPMVSNFDLSSVYYLFSGAAPLGGEVGREVSKRFKSALVQVRVFQEGEEPIIPHAHG